MTVLWGINHESGDLSGYDSTVVDGGDLSVAAAAALAGTNYGLQCVIDDTTDIYGVKAQTDPGTHRLRFRFYLDPNGVTMNAGDTVGLIYWTSSLVGDFIDVTLSYDGASLEIRARCNDDGDTWRATTFYDITDEPHYIEIDVYQATDLDDADGYIWLYIDGASKQKKANIDNFHAFAGLIGMARFGAHDPAASVAGTYFLDQLVVNNDGSVIGPYVAREPRHPGILHDGPSVV